MESFIIAKGSLSHLLEWQAKRANFLGPVYDESFEKTYWDRYIRMETKRIMHYINEIRKQGRWGPFVQGYVEAQLERRNAWITGLEKQRLYLPEGDGAERYVNSEGFFASDSAGMFPDSVSGIDEVE